MKLKLPLGILLTLHLVVLLNVEDIQAMEFYQADNESDKDLDEIMRLFNAGRLTETAVHERRNAANMDEKLFEGRAIMNKEKIYAEAARIQKEQSADQSSIINAIAGLVFIEQADPSESGLQERLTALRQYLEDVIERGDRLKQEDARRTGQEATSKPVFSIEMMSGQGSTEDGTDVVEERESIVGGPLVIAEYTYGGPAAGVGDLCAPSRETGDDILKMAAKVKNLEEKWEDPQPRQPFARSWLKIGSGSAFLALVSSIIYNWINKKETKHKSEERSEISAQMQKALGR